MNIERLKIAEEVVKIAEEVVFAAAGSPPPKDDDYEYIYDPDHKKHPGGGYQKTEKGWSKIDDKKENGDGSQSKQKQDEKNEEKLNKLPKNKHQEVSKKVNNAVQNLKHADKVKISGDTKCPPKLLDILANDEDQDIQLNVAKNTSTSAKTLDKLSKSPATAIVQATINNKNTSAETLDRLADQGWAADVAGNTSNIDPKTLEKISKNSKNYDALLKVAINPKTPKEVLSKMAEGNYQPVRFNVAKNTMTPPETLDKLSKDKNIYVRDNVSSNTSTSPQTLDKMADDESYGVQFNVIWNPNTSVETLDKLSNHKDQGLRKAVAKNPKTSVKTLVKLMGDKNSDVSAWAEHSYEQKPQEEKDAYKPKDNLPKYKFKGDDKTQAIIRKKFEKDQNEEETDTIYGEMAKFSKEDVAPMGVYHGRTKEQLKADFIKNMNPANYSSPEAFANAKQRIQKMSANDFSRILASIFADEDEQEN